MAYDCRVKTVEPQPILSIRGKTSLDELSTTIGEYLREVWAHIEKNGGKPAGPPFTRYHSTDDLDAIDLEAGIPVARPMLGAGRVATGKLPGGEVVTTEHLGSYENLPDAGVALDAWCKTNKRKAAGPHWEVYWTDPGAERDPSKLRTEVIKPLA